MLLYGRWMVLACLAGCSGTKRGGSDDGGVTGVAVETHPTLTLLSPVATDRLYEDQPVLFAGTVTDDVDDPIDIQVIWTSDVQGELDVAALPDASGAFSGEATLTPGTHLLTVKAVDTDGYEAIVSEEVTVGPPNNAPNCEIVVPADGDGGAPDDVVALTAMVSDPDVPADVLTVVWLSDIDGELGRPRPSTDGTVVQTVSVFSTGHHSLSMEVSDEVGALCVDHVSYLVGSTPEVTIILPVDGDEVSEADTVQLSGQVADPSDPLSSLAVAWRSDIDGELWAGAANVDGTVSVTVTDLTLGTHGITLSAVDPAGLAGFQTVYITVDAQPSQPVVAISPRPPTSADDLVVLIRTPSIDPEGREVVYAYRWFRDGGEYLESTGTTVSAAATRRDEEWRVVVTPSDGIGSGVSAEAVTIIQNTAPSIDEVRLSPDPATGQDALTCGDMGTIDTDDDPVAVTYTWTIDGVETAETGHTLSASLTEKGQTIFCTATPSDGVAVGEMVTSNVVVIGNAAPSILSVLITPDVLFAGDTPICNAIGFVDTDGDGDASTIVWTLDGIIVSTAATLTDPFVRANEVMCTMTPSDGESEGTPVSASITVSNTAPVMLVAEMLPWPASADSTLTCTGWGYSDVDGDDDDSFVTWSVNGGIVAIGGTLSDMFVGGDTVTCAITPSDGMDDGAPVSITQTIGNTAPTLDRVEISPMDAGPGDTLTCTRVGYDDPDDDPDASRLIWLVNDFEITGATSAELSDGFDSGDRVSCRVVVSDGVSDGPTYIDTITIGNTAPGIVALSIEPEPLTTDDVAVAYVVSEDDEGDSVSLSYAWTVNGVPVSSEGHTLDGRLYFDRGDVVVLSVTPFDGLVAGVAASTGDITVENAPPPAPAITIVPADPLEGADALTCTVLAESVDPDGDPVSYSLAWTVDGAPYDGATTTEWAGDTILAGVPVGDEEWTCSVGTDDGYSAGATGVADVVIVPTMGRSEDEPADSCRHLSEYWHTATDGVYWIDPFGDGAFLVWCDMSTDGGGWTLVAYTPSNRGVPAGFGLDAEIDPSACLDQSDFCRLDTDRINAILDLNEDTDDRFRLVAPLLPLHARYFWDTTEVFDPSNIDPDSAWWSVSLSFGGEHSDGCKPEEMQGVGHDPVLCTIDASVSHRVYWINADGDVTGADSDSSFAWYAR